LCAEAIGDEGNLWDCEASSVSWVGPISCWRVFLLSVLYSMLFTPVLTVLIYLISKKEEDELIEEFGREYEDYRRKVPMLIPRFFGASCPTIGKEHLLRLRARQFGDDFHSQNRYPLYFSVWEIPASWSARAIPYFESNLMIDAHDPDSAIYGSYIPRGPVPE